MWRRFFPVAAGIVVLAGLVASPASADTSSVVGFWVTHDGESVVAISVCPSGFCGSLVGLRRDHKPGEVPTDSKNPDAAKRSTPLCNLMMIGGFKPAEGDSAKWTDGWVYDPESGRTYSGKMTLENANTLRLRGYLGISLFGRSEVWHREAAVANRCAA